MCSIVPFAVAGLAYTSVACAGKCTFSSPYSAHIRTLQRMPQNCSVRADARPTSVVQQMASAHSLKGRLGAAAATTWAVCRVGRVTSA